MYKRGGCADEVRAGSLLLGSKIKHKLSGFFGQWTELSLWPLCAVPFMCLHSPCPQAINNPCCSSISHIIHVCVLRRSEPSRTSSVLRFTHGVPCSNTPFFTPSYFMEWICLSLLTCQGTWKLFSHFSNKNITVVSVCGTYSGLISYT